MLERARASIQRLRVCDLGHRVVCRRCGQAALAEVLDAVVGPHGKLVDDQRLSVGAAPFDNGAGATDAVPALACSAACTSLVATNITAWPSSRIQEAHAHTALDEAVALQPLAHRHARARVRRDGQVGAARVDVVQVRDAVPQVVAQRRSREGRFLVLAVQDKDVVVAEVLRLRRRWRPCPSGRATARRRPDWTCSAQGAYTDTCTP
jgi:hypothetical protein